MQYGLIMAGGAGTRLWPLSRRTRPKQLLPLVKGRSLLQLSYDRLRGLLSPDQIFVCTNAEYADKVHENLPDLPQQNLFGEPEGRDTANAVGLPAAVIAVVTADHVIEPVSRFQDALRLAFSVAKDNPNALVTFGIVPTFGH